MGHETPELINSGKNAKKDYAEIGTRPGGSEKPLEKVSSLDRKEAERILALGGAEFAASIDLDDKAEDKAEDNDEEPIVLTEECDDKS
ncbi:MAG: hypothetical protein WAV73_02740 [Candidatus Moraniibacteriota bacterium]